MNHASILSRRLQPARFFIFWVLANLMGGFITGFLENHGFQFMATLMLSGAIVGTFQWLVLKPMGGFRWWPIASALGWIIGVSLETGLRSLYEPALNQLGLPMGDEAFLLSQILHTSIWMLGMAIAQALVLRQREQAVGLWILASLVGSAINSVVSLGFCASFCQDLPSWLVGIVNGLGWAAYSLITGLAAIKSLGHSPSEEV